jgi:hypothetical protein
MMEIQSFFKFDFLCVALVKYVNTVIDTTEGNS